MGGQDGTFLGGGVGACAAGAPTLLAATGGGATGAAAAASGGTRWGGPCRGGGGSAREVYLLVHVFEAVIRVLGGLLSGHMLLTRNPRMLDGPPLQQQQQQGAEQRAEQQQQGQGTGKQEGQAQGQAGWEEEGAWGAGGQQQQQQDDPHHAEGGEQQQQQQGQQQGQGQRWVGPPSAPSGGPSDAPPAPSYDGVFLSKAVELADRLLPAFDTPSGLPALFVNLRSGLVKDGHNATCTAAAAHNNQPHAAACAVTLSPALLGLASIGLAWCGAHLSPSTCVWLTALSSSQIAWVWQAERRGVGMVGMGTATVRLDPGASSRMRKRKQRQEEDAPYAHH
ncbi:hypothetical protein TSOC_012232 [Tetrabaena socialis]|uniref:Alpha-1,2-Mannosidase n=1 Tax=Tetrabaena socialis TaxID=47790 RepID=A0A2J7ZNI7_9CHLO|nr:hypothetical protein TSOC_012232 [Tetrabaena socialis]|eukprot:PNH01839.1 hypothetical protein TSOC_012232 [Tetrabaena socialis]